MNKSAKILIVEDEYITAKTIAKFLESSGYHVVGCAMNIEESLLFLKNYEIDCVVLDININDEKDGIWIANYIQDNYNIPFIFLTAYTDNQTMSRAIDTSPYGFLAKPFQKPELFSAIEIALLKHNQLLSTQRQNKEDNSDKEKSIFLKNIDKFDRVLLSDINFIESQKNYLSIHTNTDTYKHRATLKDFIELLPDNHFIKAHRAFIINLSKIDFIDKVNNIICINKVNIPISKPFKKEILDRIKEL